MAASRKLQGEIDRCLKKVAEGVEQFEDIWKKVYNATNSNQKEKYEADLKKEIKKLQRLRDQIKSWLTSAEIKDKSQLLENRKLIETQMERFKVVERETKTKAYSKEGLGAAQNKDPAQKERDETNRWLSECIDNLNLQMDQYESEIESLMAAGKKKKIDKDKSGRIDGLKETLEKHRFHIKKLEVLMRMLNNETVDCEQIKMIKDDIEYYLESHQDPDYVDNDCMYDDIEMEDLDFPAPEINVGKPNKVSPVANGNNLHTILAGGSHDSTEGSTPSSSVCGSSPAPSPAATNIHSSEPNDAHNNQALTPSISAASTTTTTTPASNAQNERKKTSKSEEARAARAGSQNNTPVKPQVVRPSNTSVTLTGLTNHSTKATPPPSTPTKPVSGSISQTTPNNSSSSSGLHNHVNSPSQHNRDFIHGSIGSGVSHNIINCHNSHPTTPITNNSSHASTNGPTIINSSSNSNSLPDLASKVTSPPNSSASSVTCSSQAPRSNTTSTEQGVSLKAMAQKKLNEVNPCLIAAASDRNCTSLSTSNVSANHVNSMMLASMTNSNQSHSLLATMAGSSINCANSKQSTTAGTAKIPLVLGVAPLGPVHLTEEHTTQFERVQAAFYHMPHPSDSERFRLHFPRQPCQTPVYYPQVPPPLSDTVEFFQRLSTETLFFIFYYMEGTKAQYLAAKALKKQSWRFHTKFMMWFQRHEEPRSITDEYEQGTYIFFDCENWGQRKRENFVFEYRYLEDRDLN